MRAREPTTLLLFLLLPVSFTVVLGLTSSEEVKPLDVGVIREAGDPGSARLERNLQGDPGFEVIPLSPGTDLRNEFEQGNLDAALVLPDLTDGGTVTFVFDETQAQQLFRISGAVEAFIQRYNLEVSGAPETIKLQARGLRAERRLGTFNYMLPGLLVFFVIFATVTVVSSGVASNRDKRIFKRLLATPLRPREFVLAEVGTWTILAMGQVALLLVVGVFWFGMEMGGEVAWVFLLVGAGVLIFLCLGFIIGSTAKSAESAGLLGSIITFPLLFISGVFGPTDALPVVLGTVGRYLPLAPVIDAVRTVTLDGASPFSQPGTMLVIGGWMLVMAAVAAKTFKFSDMPRGKAG